MYNVLFYLCNRKKLKIGYLVNLGIPKRLINSLRHGYTDLTIAQLDAIADFFEISAGVLLDMRSDFSADGEHYRAGLRDFEHDLRGPG